jgi:hypothetical protein
MLKEKLRLKLYQTKANVDTALVGLCLGSFIILVLTAGAVGVVVELGRSVLQRRKECSTNLGRKYGRISDEEDNSGAG